MRTIIEQMKKSYEQRKGEMQGLGISQDEYDAYFESALRGELNIEGLDKLMKGEI